MTQPFKRGDIVRRPAANGLIEFAHVEQAHPRGGLDVILDRGGAAAGWNAGDPNVAAATMEELLEARAVRIEEPPEVLGFSPRRGAP